MVRLAEGSSAMNENDKDLPSSQRDDYEAGFENAWKIASQYAESQLKYATVNPTVSAVVALEDLLGMMAEFRLSQSMYKNAKVE